MTSINILAPAVLITGVSSGIGEAMANFLLSRGYRVFGSIRKLADAQRLIDSWADSFVPVEMDVTDHASVEAAVASVQKALAGSNLTALINNAGVSAAGPLLEQPWEEIQSTFEVNVFGLLKVTRSFAVLLGRGSEMPGRIVNISSVSGMITVPFLATYAASKHAVEALTQGLRRELLSSGIHVAAIEPGFIRTPLFEKSKKALNTDSYTESGYSNSWAVFNETLRGMEKRAKSPDVVCKAVLHAISAKQPKSRYPLDGLWWIGKYLPDRVFDQLILNSLGLSAWLKGSDVKPLSVR